MDIHAKGKLKKKQNESMLINAIPEQLHKTQFYKEQDRQDTADNTEARMRQSSSISECSKS